MNARGVRAAVALSLEAVALAALALAVLGVSWLDPGMRPRIVMIVDRSLSMPKEATDAAVARAVDEAKAGGGAQIAWVEFAGKPAGLASLAGVASAAELDAGATNIETALHTVLAAHAQNPFAGAVLISDGFETTGDTARALREARDARLPLQWIAVGRPQPDASITDVLAPHGASTGQPIQLAVQIDNRTKRSLRVTATARDASGDAGAVSGEPDAQGRATLDFVASGKGTLLFDVTLDDPTSGVRLDTRRNAAAVDVKPRAAMLYVQGSAGPLPASLVAGGWALDVVPATRMEAQSDRLEGYQAIVLDDVAVADAGAPFWSSLVTAVKARGTGLMVLGGERAFARGGYRGSLLESVLPVLSEPAALDDSASVVFAVDKSGSMGSDSGGVDRFRLAQRAVIETARGLGERDSLALVVFDVEPRVLIPLMAASTGRVALERDWPALPRGGTRLVPGLDAAIGQLERSAAARRLLVVVSDGFIEDSPLEGLRERLAQSRIETIALAIGPAADLAAMQRLVGPQQGVVLRVNQAAQLPQIMRSGVEQRRARIERGAIAVHQSHPLPFAAGVLSDWPPIASYAVTRSRPEATVAVQSERGDPVVAFQVSGLGRVIAVTPGLGSWAPGWTSWREWPRLAGGLADWIGGVPDDGALWLAATDVPRGLVLDADLRTASGWGDPGGVSVTARTPTAAERAVRMEAVAPGRMHAVLSDDGPGLYTIVMASAEGTRRLLHVRRNRAESDRWGTNPALQMLQREGLIDAWNPGAFARVPSDERPPPVDRWLVGLALALFAAGVLVDRSPLRRR